MAYIEIRQTLPAHRKVKAAARELHCGRHKLIGHLVCLWVWALDNIPSDGSLRGIADADLAEAAEWPVGRAEAFVAALTSAEFVDVTRAGARYLHDWEDYAGRLLKRREQNKDNQRAHRERQRSAADDADVSADTPLTSASGHHPTRAPARARTVTVPSPTLSSGERVPAARDAHPDPVELAVDQALTPRTGTQPQYETMHSFEEQLGTAVVVGSLQSQTGRDRYGGALRELQDLAKQQRNGKSRRRERRDPDTGLRVAANGTLMSPPDDPDEVNFDPPAAAGGSGGG